MLDALVVGAGPSGLAALRRLKEAGFTALALEKRYDVGGNWLYEEGPNRHSSAYKTLVTITSKACSEFEGHPFPKEWPDYLPHELVQKYFRSYAERFGLLDLIRFGTEVAEAIPTQEGWQVRTTAGETYTARYLFAASGHHWKPYLPSYPGTFTGESYHSHHYTDPAQLYGKRVLVIGAGNSGADIASDAVRTAKSVDLSVRRGYYITPKFAFFGEPSDALYRKLIAPLPRFLHAPMAALTLRLLVGPIERYGMQRPHDNYFYTHPIMNTELLYNLRHGRIRLRGSISHLEGDRVYFTDGTSESYDTIIWATGYEITFPYLPEPLVPKAENIERIWLHIFSLDEPRLIFMGLIQPTGCLWNLSEKQASLAVRYMRGVYRFPADVEQQSRTYWQAQRKRYAESPRHLLEVDWYEYARLLDRLIRKHPLPQPAHA